MRTRKETQCPRCNPPSFLGAYRTADKPLDVVEEAAIEAPPKPPKVSVPWRKRQDQIIVSTPSILGTSFWLFCHVCAVGLFTGHTIGMSISNQCVFAMLGGVIDIPLIVTGIIKFQDRYAEAKHALKINNY